MDMKFVMILIMILTLLNMTTLIWMYLKFYSNFTKFIKDRIEENATYSSQVKDDYEDSSKKNE